MERPAWAPRSIDISVPSVSRIYDYYLGGSHNFEVDREAARKAMEFMPGLPKIMQANRAFMRRAVRFAVDEGVTQFLDIGSGIPTFGNVHEVAQAARPGARVVYVDHDPVAVAHSEAVLAGNDAADVLAADLRKPREILSSPPGGAAHRPEPAGGAPSRCHTALRGGRGRPVRCGGRAERGARARQPAAAHARLVRGAPLLQQQAEGAVDVYKDIRNPLIMRSRDEITRFFEGYDMVEPGLVPMPHWRPETAPEDEDPYAFSGFAGVGRKA
ncbi:SAM-dependent methyltransferase [Streptomyces thermocoprophilus]